MIVANSRDLLTGSSSVGKGTESRGKIPVFVRVTGGGGGS